MKSLPTILTIAGSDCSAGAGIQADLKSIHANGGYALTVATAVTAQNSHGVKQVYALPAEQVKAQLNAIIEDYKIAAIKIGMLANAQIMEVVIECLKPLQEVPIVLDTVLLSSSGKPLLEENAVEVMVNKLFPLVTLITPNIPEMLKLLNLESNQATKSSLEPEFVLKQLKIKKWPNCLLKGGHSQEEQAIDYLLLAAKNQAIDYASPRIKAQHNHGTGCTLSSAIATQLAKGHSIEDAVNEAKSYLFKTLKTAHLAQPKYNKASEERHGGLNHFVDI
ncbi:bifunctional hydroxymethylpyrimidine kinase/phosphomethylpyrimidine kinase [Thiomicrorhabdus sp. Milos-T2]|uniref:bifunctional hydroxymethylpyrimidine kinase/phosphomethylpyrimidine kinase n=1 Tax=Thiomicrorhabdus sp. Milos-T2 TaxID=90814 RepID=UPI000494717A|nr:bifunctional hydroxymethylpyrimidine kinase/phosphomethylpyrimidine kinase [Thiomicrorhabdus sp. Milos-T2]